MDNEYFEIINGHLKSAFFSEKYFKTEMYMLNMTVNYDLGKQNSFHLTKYAHDQRDHDNHEKLCLE